MKRKKIKINYPEVFQIYYLDNTNLKQGQQWYLEDYFYFLSLTNFKNNRQHGIEIIIKENK